MPRNPFDKPTHTELSVSGTTQEALAENTGRNYALFVNDSDTIMYLGIGVAAVSLKGIRLNANGGSYEMSEATGNLFIDAVNAIGGTTKNLLIMEA